LHEVSSHPSPSFSFSSFSRGIGRRRTRDLTRRQSVSPLVHQERQIANMRRAPLLFFPLRHDGQIRWLSLFSFPAALKGKEKRVPMGAGRPPSFSFFLPLLPPVTGQSIYGGRRFSAPPTTSGGTARRSSLPLPPPPLLPDL